MTCPGSDDEKSKGERWYDAEIAPALLALGQKCKDRGISFLAAVFYGGDEQVGVTFIEAKPTLSVRWADYAARSHWNLDALVIAIGKDAKEHGVSTDASFVARLMGWHA